MEFVEGTTLARLVEQQGPLPVAQACDYVRQATLGLQRAFEHGMVHRDIKPHNLMRTPQGVVKILDFGLARLLSETSAPLPPAKEVGCEDAAPANLTQVGMVMGTADYMAPEQGENAHTADIRADIYSLGCTLYYLLSGQAPFPEGTTLDKLSAHRMRKPRPLSDFRKDVPPGLFRVVERMMAKDPAQRYQTPEEAAEALRPFITASRRPRRSVYAVAIPLLAAALMMAVVIFVRTDKGELILESDDPEIAVQIDEAGVKIRDSGSKREYLLKAGKQPIASGEYNIDVSELPDGIEVSTPKFQLRRGDRVIVAARYRVPRPRPQSAVPGIMLGSVLPRYFNDSDVPITQDGVTPSAHKGSWRIETKGPRTIRLFEIPMPVAEECRVTYRAQLKCQNLEGKAYLEMWCRFPGQGEFFSKDLLHPLSGTTDWASYETPFFLKKSERPDLIKLNVVIEGKGTVWIKDVSLRKAPLTR